MRVGSHPTRLLLSWYSRVDIVDLTLDSTSLFPYWHPAGANSQVVPCLARCSPMKSNSQFAGDSSLVQEMAGQGQLGIMIADDLVGGVMESNVVVELEAEGFQPVIVGYLGV